MVVKGSETDPSTGKDGTGFDKANAASSDAGPREEEGLAREEIQEFDVERVEQVYRCE